MWENSVQILRQIENIGIYLLSSLYFLYFNFFFFSFIFFFLLTIGTTKATNLSNAGIFTFDDLEKADPRRIEIVSFVSFLSLLLINMKYKSFLKICGRNSPFGNQIQDTVRRIPRVIAEIKQVFIYYFLLN